MRTVSQNSAGTLNSQTPTSNRSEQAGTGCQPSRSPDQQSIDPTIHQSGITPPLPHSSTPGFVVLPPQPEFKFQKGLGCWLVTRQGMQAVLKREIAMDYVTWLDAHPGEYIHALDLAARIHAAKGKEINTGITEVENPLTGERVQVEAHSRVQERGLFLDDAIAMRVALRRQAKLEAFVEDEATTEPEKEEAYRELISLYDFEKQKERRVRDAAAKASDAVGRAISRLVKRLAQAVDDNGQPHPVLQPLAKHITDHILNPSGRGAHGGVRSQAQGGYFVYEPA